MQVALAAVAEGGGGVAVVDAGKVVARVALPVAGLLSDRRAPAVAAEMEALKRAWAALGLTLPFMGFNLIPLSVIPDLRITDQGSGDGARHGTAAVVRVEAGALPQPPRTDAFA